MNPSKALSKLDDIIARLGKFKPIRAYHGSPYDFDRFDASKIDTGQGAQSYGRGLYFAENERVADSYRRMLSGSYTHALATDEDVAQYFTPGNIVDGYGGKDKVLAFHANKEEPWRWHVEVIRVGDDGLPMPGERPRAHSTTPHLADVDMFFGRPPRRPGHTYEVEIGLPEQSLLDWDKPVLSQPAAVRSAMIGLGAVPDIATQSRWRGGDSYQKLVTRVAHDPLLPTHGRAASEIAAIRMLDAGIPGIRYLDQGSRAAGEGTRNYVIFPGAEDAITILRKYGFLPPVAAAAAMSGEEQ